MTEPSGYIMGAMTPVRARVAAFFAVTALLALAAPQADAAPRRVAVVNAAADQNAGAAAAVELRRVLGDLEPLAPIPAGNLARSLERPLAGQTATERAVAAAREALARAQSHYQSFALDRALSELARAESGLIGLVPDDAVRAVLAEIELRRGVILMGKPDRSAATAAFRLARTLAPDRTSLDAAVFDPEVVKTFAAAAPGEPDATLEITTAYDGAQLYVDGRPATGPAVRVSAGRHLVAASFPEHRSAGQIVELTGGQTRAIKLELWPMSSDEQAAALRRDLADGAGTAELVAAAQRVATLTGLDAVILIRGATPGQIDVAVYDGRSGKLGDWAPLQGADPKELLASILPAARVAPVRPPIEIRPPLPPPPEVPWWKQRKWQATIGGGAAVTILGILVYSLATDDGSGMVGGTWGGF
jgi:hypothetical protein